MRFQAGGGFNVVSDVTRSSGAPYSATVVNESVQTLADGNRIVQKTTGTTARDSEGRTRNDAPLPMIGNMSSAGAPHLVFIVDPGGANILYFEPRREDRARHGQQDAYDVRPGVPDVAAAKLFARANRFQLR